MKKKVQTRPCNNSLDLNSDFGYHNNRGGSRNNAMVENKMCKQKTALKALKETHKGIMPDWAITLHEAQAEDFTAMDVRMSNVERDVKEIKETMVTKDDLTHLKEEIIPAIQGAAKYDLVKSTVNWKTVLLFIGLIVVAAFGLRAVEFLSTVIEKIF